LAFLPITTVKQTTYFLSGGGSYATIFSFLKKKEKGFSLQPLTQDKIIPGFITTNAFWR